ncbi:MAG: choice-of-anchor D domain-containing protein [Bryobacteraceae bacterium]
MYRVSGSTLAIRELMVALPMAVLIVSCPSAQAQIAMVHATPCGPAAFPGTICTIPATGGGNLIVVGFSSAPGTVPTITAIADNAGNAYIEAPNALGTDASANTVDIWYAKNSNPGAASLTITPNPSGSGGTAVIWEFSGADTISPLDQVAALNNQVATGSPTGAPVTTTAPVEAVVSVTAPQYWMVGLVSATSFIQDFVVNNNNYAGGWAHLITSSTGVYSPVWTTGLDTYTSTSASFKSASYSACDLNQDGVVNVLDVQLATNMALVPTNCTAPYGQCNLPLVQAVLTSAMGGPCSLAVLGVAPSNLSFGNVAVGSTSTQTVTLTGIGTGATTISQAAVSGAGFSLSGLSLPLTLAAGQNVSFSVAFAPAATGSASGSIAFTSSALNTPFSQTLSGNGITTIPHSVSLSWTPSTSSNIATYNIYRIASASSTAPATPYSNMGSISATTCNPNGCAYTDTAVQAGQSYWYYSTAVDTGSNESTPSNIVQAVVPTP